MGWILKCWYDDKTNSYEIEANVGGLILLSSLGAENLENEQFFKFVLEDPFVSPVDDRLKKHVAEAIEYVRKHHDSMYMMVYVGGQGTPVHWHKSYSPYPVMKPPLNPPPSLLAEDLPGMGERVTHPVSGEPNKQLMDVVISLNDTYKWTREEIADWLETLDIDITFKEKT